MNPAQTLHNVNSHRWAHDGDPEDGNVICRDCDTKPGNRDAAEPCGARQIRRANHPTMKGKR